MDPFYKVATIGVLAVAVITVVKTIASGVLRYEELRRPAQDIDARTIQERLERIEIAVDAIAVEVERLGEHQRFNAQLALNRPEQVPAKVVTPH